MDDFRDVEIEGHRLVAILIHLGDTDLPVVFLHGIGGSIYFWTPELTSLFHYVGSCYSLSLPGHFPAAFPKGLPSDCLTAELVAGLTAHAIRQIVGKNKVLLVGHSTGGFAALSTAIYHPEVAAGIVSIAGFAQGRWIGALGLNQWLVRQGTIGCALFKTIYRLGKYRVLFRLFWDVYANDHIALWKDPHFGTVIKNTFPYLQKLDLDAMVSYFAVMPHTDITSCLSKITVPVFVIAGDEDPIVPPKQSVMIAGKVPGAKLAIIKGSGHLPFFERPTEYERAIGAWLTEFQASCRS